jgi:uncharacterized protein YbjT (DUF2867 family)
MTNLNNKTYTILGVTGHVGSETAELLLRQGLPVKAVIRSGEKARIWNERRAATAVANLLDTEALTKALSDTAGLFVMTPPLLDSSDPIGEHRKMLTALDQAIRETRPGKLVYLSSIGAQHVKGTGAIKKLYDMEQVFRQLPVPTAGIRAGWFMENFAGAIDHVKATGQLVSFLDPTDLAIPMIAAKDISRLAAALLQQDWEGHRIIELEGPCRYSADDVAQVLSYLIGKPVSAEALPSDQYAPAYRSFGASPEAAVLMSEMNRGFNSRWIDFEGAGNEHALGLTLLEDNLKNHI